MLEQSEIKKMLAEVENIKSQIRQKKQELNRLNSTKESWFKKKKEVSTQISGKINELRSSKSKVNNLSKEVKSLKDEKSHVSEKIKKLATEIRALKQEYDSACSKLGIKDNPSFIKKKIDSLEYALETSAIGFEQEKKLNKEIKRLKKLYSQMSEVSKIWNVIEEKENQIDELKGVKSGTLNKLKGEASQKHDLSEDFISNSQEIMDLRKTESEYYKNFMDAKAEFKTQTDELKDILVKKTELLQILSENNVVLKEMQKKKQDEEIKEKRKEVNEKLKKNEKLTTEDLLIFQRAL